MAAKLYRSKPFSMHNRAPVVSFTFDDVPDSAYLNGAAILEDHGIRGTFYIAGGTCGTQEEYWRVIDQEQVGALHDAGHEIGCHTFSHINVDRLDALEMDEECRRNDRWGKTKGKIGFHGGKVEIERPRLRSFEGKEQALPSWEAAISEDWLGKWAMNQMLINVSTRKFARSVRPPPVASWRCRRCA
jgi:peptidoglycan/xylan/chitin deacetylase (PgdA/CDA1 family)